MFERKDLRCQVGDLAVVVRCYNLSNIGKIVRIVSPYSPESANYIPNDFGTYDWVVVTYGHLTWLQLHPYKRWRRKRGPASDDNLSPIRGLQMSPQALDQLTDRPGFRCRYYSHSERPLYPLCM